MKTISRFLSESYPDNPTDIVLKNKFYPQGLTEEQIYNHYQTYKKKLLDWIHGRHVSFFLNIDGNTIVKRKIDNKPITLTNENFNEILNGRTNVLTVEYPAVSNYWILDLDLGLNITRSQLTTTIKKLLAHKPLTSSATKIEVLHSSFRGAHIIGYVEKKSIQQQRRFVLDALSSLALDRYVVINTKGRQPDTINIDLSPMNDRGLHICRYSLTKEALICDDFFKPIRKIRGV
jgi:hypothetical protein